MSAPSPVSNLVTTAEAFLRNPKVQNATREQKIRFLFQKGLTADQILAAFHSVGEVKVTLEEVKAAIATMPAAGGAAGREGVTSPVVRSHTAYPAPIPSPSQSVEEGSKWRHVLAGGVAGVVGGLAAMKMWERYSPYEWRRKEEGLAGGGELPVEREVPLQQQRSLAPVPPLPKVPLPPLPASPPTLPTADGPDADELEKLRKEVTDLTAALDAERKSKAEISIRASKMKSEKLSLLQKVDRLEEKVSSLEEELKALKPDAADSQEEMLLGEQQGNSPTIPVEGLHCTGDAENSSPNPGIDSEAFFHPSEDLKPAEHLRYEPEPLQSPLNTATGNPAPLTPGKEEQNAALPSASGTMIRIGDEEHSVSTSEPAPTEE